MTSYAPINDARDRPELFERILAKYERNADARRVQYLHVLGNASLTRHGHHGYIASFSGEEPITKLSVPKELGAVSFVYAIPRNRTGFVTVQLGDIDVLRKDLLSVVGEPGVFLADHVPEDEEMIMDVEDDADVLKKWRPCLASDSPSSMVAIVRHDDQSRHRNDATEYYLIVQTSLRSAVRTARRNAKKRGETLGSFVESEAYRRLMLYTQINAHRLAHLISLKLNLGVGTMADPMEGAAGDVYADVASPMSGVTFVEVWTLDTQDKATREVTREYITYNHAVELNNLNKLEQTTLLVQRTPRVGYTLFSVPREFPTRPRTERRLDPVPVDVPFYGVPAGVLDAPRDEYVLSHQPHLENVYSSDAAFRSEENENPEAQWETHYGLSATNQVSAKHLTMVLMILSPVDPASMSLEALQGLTAEGEPVWMPINHKWVRYASKQLVRHRKHALARQEIFARPKANEFYFAIPRKTFAELNDLVQGEPRYATKLSKLNL